MSDYYIVTLAGGQQFVSGSREPGPNGIRTVRTLRGWFEQAPNADGVETHWSGNGSFVTDYRLGARTIEMRGLLQAPTRQRLMEMRDQLARWRRGTFTVDEQDLGVVREATVRQVDSAFVTVSPLIVDYSLTFVADDPLRYRAGSRTIWNGAPTISNDGDQTAYPILTLEGPHSAVTIEHPGGTYTFAAVPTGQTRVLDFRNGDVWNGQARVFGAESGPRPEVRPGGSQWHVSGLGSGSTLLERYEAWS